MGRGREIESLGVIAARDLEVCRAAIRTGSHTFDAASRLMPRGVRDHALALYAFCRFADDAVDEGAKRSAAVEALRERLDHAYAGRPRNAPADRAFAAMIAATQMPRALPEALLDGFAWDAEGRRHATLSDVRAYAARVASSVGAMMCVLMGVRDAPALARACDLGAAMQLTNIARDVGEDLRAGRIYLPLDWLPADDPAALLRAGAPAVSPAVRRLLREADDLYIRAEAGIGVLPAVCRPGIFAARHIYAGIGGAVRRNGCDSLTRRACLRPTARTGLLGLALIRTATTFAMPRSAVLHARPLPETAFLVAAAASRPAPETAWGDGRLGGLLSALATLKRHDLARGVDESPVAAM